MKHYRLTYFEQKQVRESVVFCITKNARLSKKTCILPVPGVNYNSIYKEIFCATV